MLPNLLLSLALLLPNGPRNAPSSVVRPRAAAPLMCSDWNPGDEEFLRQAIERSSQSTRLGSPQSVLHGLRSAIVLIFNAGRPDEGVYTLQGRSERSSSYVLAFEYNEDADRFAQLLQAEGFDLATPLEWEVGQLAHFCNAGHFEVSLVPTGGMLTPPAKNEYDVDAFERQRRDETHNHGADDGESRERADMTEREQYEHDVEVAKARSFLERLFEM